MPEIDNDTMQRLWYNFWVVMERRKPKQDWKKIFVSELPPYQRQPDVHSCELFFIFWMEYWNRFIPDFVRSQLQALYFSSKNEDMFVQNCCLMTETLYVAWYCKKQKHEQVVIF